MLRRNELKEKDFPRVVNYFIFIKFGFLIENLSKIVSFYLLEKGKL